MTRLRELLDSAALPSVQGFDFEELVGRADRNHRNRIRSRFAFAIAVVLVAGLVSVGIVQRFRDPAPSRLSTAPATHAIDRTTPDGAHLTLDLSSDSELLKRVRDRLDASSRLETSAGRAGPPAECYPDQSYVARLDVAEPSATLGPYEGFALPWSRYPIQAWLFYSVHLDADRSASMVAARVYDSRVTSVALRSGSREVDRAPVTQRWVALGFLNNADPPVVPLPDVRAELVGYGAGGEVITTVSIPEPPVTSGWC